MRRLLQLFAALSLALASGAHAQHDGEGTIWENPHHKFVQSYEGTKTCLACHEEQAKHAFASIHYQWKAAAPNIVNSQGRALGKINTTNDFCTNPSFQWISILTNEQGQVIGNGCSKCHAGLGLKPAAEMTRAQLENIDCLVCHAPNYRREVAKQPDGTLAWVPAGRNSPELMLNIAQNVGKPTSNTCLRCHVGSGGGLNYKRGDLETAHANATRAFDVHMGSGMQCIQCHKFEDHKVKGAGTQISGMDVPSDARPQCEGCHKGAVHKDARLNRHASAVYCTTCHIPEFAKVNPTDVHRDWSKSMFVKDEGKFEPYIEFGKNVKPTYAWWNGTGRIAHLDQKVQKEANGKVALYKPEGSIDDPKARIYAFKYHTGRLPVETSTGHMIPVAVGPVFRTGKNEAGVAAGAKNWFGRDVKDVGWIDVERYMGLFHEVAPKEKALGCNDCHGANGRMDWQALGYKGDPAKTGARRVKAASR